jgi:hypothetical protein
MEFYATLARGFSKKYLQPGFSYLLPASSYARNNFPAPNLPAHCNKLAADSGGFAATLAGGYSYSPETYLDWLDTFNPTWAATFDKTCLFGGPVKEYQEYTTDMASYFFQNYKEAAWAFVPTIQGKTVADFTHHARQLAPVINEMRRYYAASGNNDFRVGIGSLVRRPAPEVQTIVSNMAAELPGIPFHLWGVKLKILKDRIALNRQVISIDSSVWFDRWSCGNERWRQSGMKKDEFAAKISLFEYMEKIDASLNTDKQLTLF